MAQTEKAHGRTSSTEQRTSWSWKRLFGSSKDENQTAATSTPPQEPQQQQRPGGLARRLSKKVIPGLPRAGTFKRQQSELRDRLEPVKPNVDERRTVSVDRRTKSGRNSSTAIVASARLSAPELFEPAQTIDAVLEDSTLSRETTQDGAAKEEFIEVEKEPSLVDTRSISTENYDDEDQQILAELESKWILNLSMHFRDKSKREKFFVTYAETPTHWRRVTISLDYRDAPEGSLEEELERTRFQRDKSARIYEAIRESLPDIQFYDTVTNLKLQTENERLHVHVVEDLSEIISYPPVKAIKHLSCRRVREDELVFDSHLSGFVYKVRVGGQVFIKKEIPGPDTVDEFLYEINALHQLSGSRSVIQFGGVVLDNKGELVKGLLISFADQGALIDVIYDGEGQIPWSRRERWARQIVQGLSEIHEAGFVQGDFTLSNIVIDEDDNAKIIDINRRGCPVGWEPPEVAALIESNQRISMYIGVKSDLYQLGMVLYALATQQDEPENHRPLNLAAFPLEIPDYFFDLCHRCLNVNPRCRSQASALLALFPPIVEDYSSGDPLLPIVVEARHVDDLPPTNGHKIASHNGSGYPSAPYTEKPVDTYDYAVTDTSEEGDYPRRGRSPPAPYLRKSLPYEIPLPPSSSGSDDTESPATPVADELTPVASRVGHGEKDVADLSGSIHEASQEQAATGWMHEAEEPKAEDAVASPSLMDHAHHVICEESAPPSPPPSYHEILIVEKREKDVTDRITLDDHHISDDVAELSKDVPQEATQDVVRAEPDTTPVIESENDLEVVQGEKSAVNLIDLNPDHSLEHAIVHDGFLDVPQDEPDPALAFTSDPEPRLELEQHAPTTTGEMDKDILHGKHGVLQPIISKHGSEVEQPQVPASHVSQDKTHDCIMELQPISKSPESRETEPARDTSMMYPDLAFVGTHIEIPSISDLTIPSGPDFDDLTKETHNDRIVLESSATG